jgi:sugar phosphate permease
MIIAGTLTSKAAVSAARCGAIAAYLFATITSDFARRSKRGPREIILRLIVANTAVYACKP